MANINIYIDADTRKVLAGPDSSQTIDAGSLPLSFGDNPTFNIYLRTKSSSINPVVYKAVPTTGLTLFFYLNDGLIDGTIYTQQITWTPDSGATFFTAKVAMNTLALKTLIGTSTTGPCAIKIGYAQNGDITTVLSDLTKVGVGLPSTSLVVPAGQTALTAEVAASTYFGLQPVNGRPMKLATATGRIVTLLAVDNSDGTASLNAS